MQSRHRWSTVGDIPRHFARRPPDSVRCAVTSDDGDQTWAELEDESNRVAHALAALGVTTGDCVAVLLPNCGAFPELMFGIAKLGAVIVPLNAKLTRREVAFCLTFSEPQALVVSAALLPAVHEIASEMFAHDRIVVVGGPGDEGGVSYEQAKAAASLEPVQVDVDEDAVYWMPFTSGTTGEPKAAMVTHRALVEHWRMVTHEFELRQADTTLIAGPFYHSLGFLFGLSTLYAGGHVVIQSDFDPGRVLRGIEQHAATVTPMVPTMYTMLLGHDDRHRVDLTSLRLAISAGSPLLTTTKNELLDLFPSAELVEFYGSTEMGIATALPPEDARRKERCVGLPVLGAEVRILDEDGNDCAPGQMGEIHKRGALLGGAYHKNPEATAAAYRGEWFASGDLGMLDEEGYLYIVDRRKDMIITGGANVFPSEIEEVVARHPAVLEVAVIGVPDEVWGERVTAVVVTRPDWQVDTDELLTFCEQDLATYKRPRQVLILDQLPKNGSGKVLKRELRERFWQGIDARV